MAIAATTVFECNASATAGNINGGGFNPANANYLTDGSVTNGNTSSPTISSATAPFAAGDVGAWVYFIGQTHITNCYAQIASVDGGGVATLTAGVGTLNYPTVPVWTNNTTAGISDQGSTSSVNFLVDYSRSTSSRQQWTNLSGVSASTTITDASAGHLFNKKMAGNLICISAGTNATKGWYEIVSVTDTDNAVLDRTPNSGTMSATTGNVGGAISLNGSTASITDSSFFSIAGNSSSASIINFIKSGSYTTAVAITVAAGNVKWFRYIEGYNSIRGDTPTGDNRPYLALANAFSAGQYNEFRNLRTYGSTIQISSITSDANFFNNKLVTTGTVSALSLTGTSGRYNVFYNEIVCNRGSAIQLAGGRNIIYANTIRDSNKGIADSSTASNYIINNIIEGIGTTGIEISSSTVCTLILNNTLIGMPTPNSSSIGIDVQNAGSGPLVYNNIIWGWVTATQGKTASVPIVISDYNNYYNNTTNKNIWYGGNNDIALDPKFDGITNTTNQGTCSTSTTTLTDSTQDFTAAGVVAGRDAVLITTNTGGNTGIFNISSVGTTTLTLDRTAGTGSGTVYQIMIGKNAAFGNPFLKSLALAQTYPCGYSASHISHGALQLVSPNYPVIGDVM